MPYRLILIFTLIVSFSYSTTLSKEQIKQIITQASKSKKYKIKNPTKKHNIQKNITKRQTPKLYIKKTKIAQKKPKKKAIPFYLLGRNSLDTALYENRKIKKGFTLLKGEPAHKKKPLNPLYKL